MAEWMEVMRQWRRMCDKHTCSRNKDALTGLPICPIAATHEGYPCDEDPIDWTEKATKQLEEIVMSWAAEHPVVYPTWYEFMRENKIIPDVLEDCGDYYKTIGKWLVKATIKHDIAEKLEIEPKEGT